MKCNLNLDAGVTSEDGLGEWHDSKLLNWH